MDGSQWTRSELTNFSTIGVQIIRVLKICYIADWRMAVLGDLVRAAPPYKLELTTP